MLASSALITDEAADYSSTERRVTVFQQVVLDAELLADLVGADDPDPDEAQALAKSIRDTCQRLLTACMATVAATAVWLELAAHKSFW